MCYHSFRLIFIIGVITLFSACQSQQPVASVAFDPIDYVDPFIGTGEHGHTFPGAAMPFGMVQLSPDTHLDGWDASSGYHNDDPQIYGFSHTHLSGTGIGDMGDILLLPFTGAPSDTMQATFSKASETATPGHYQVTFDNYQVKAELTATTRVGVHRYTYGEDQDQHLMIDLGHILQSNWGHKSVEGTLEVVDSQTIRGYRKSSGWAYDHPVYFYLTCSRPFEISSMLNGNQAVDLVNQQVEGSHLKAFLGFGKSAEALVVKVGLSPVSMEGAQKNMETEMPNWDFDAIKDAAQAEWRKRLSVIEITSSDEAVLKNFYTALYHSLFAPMCYQDVDGKYRGMDKRIHQAAPGKTNYTVFSLWDTFRAWHPLMTIVEPAQCEQWVAALLEKYREGGVLPKWPLLANYTGTMVGYPAVSVIADAMVKDLGGFDPALALEAATFSSEYHPEVTARLPEPRAMEVMPKQLKFVANADYIPADSCIASVSYGVECAYYDWCVSKIAEIAGNDSVKEVYQQRAQHYRNYFDPAVGFMRGKMADGSWKTPFSPRYSDHQDGDYVEGNAWQWSWFVPHDVDGLMELMGGKKAFSAKLDSLFIANSEVEGEHASADISGLIGQYAHGNEPSHHIPYLYLYAGDAHKAQNRLDEILYTLYSPTPEGISGNEDCGQMSAWYVLNAMGFYQPCPGDPTYAIGRPVVESATIRLGNGKTFRITTQNNSPKHKYVQQASLNGKVLESLFFTHQQLMAGGELVIEMTEESFEF